MNDFFQQHSVAILSWLVSLFLLVIGFVIVEYYRYRAKEDKEQIKAINGLGVRLNDNITTLKTEINAFRLETKADLREVSTKIDHAINTVHEIDKKVIIRVYEDEVKRSRSAYR